MGFNFNRMWWKRHLLALLLVIAASTAAEAQSTPPPPRNGSGSTLPAVGQQIGQVLFSAAEKKIIEQFFGHSATNAEATPTTDERVLQQVLDRVIGQAAPEADERRSDDQGDDEDDDEHDGKKGQKYRNDKDGKHDGKYKEHKKERRHREAKGRKLPPGLSRRANMPPGLQKQMDRNGRLPPGLANRELPANLQTRLPPPVSGTERVISGNDMVLVDQATGVILDILRDVVTGNR